MIQRLAQGQLPDKHHQALYTKQGKLAYEHCHTLNGFDGPYTISYHLHRPQSLKAVAKPGSDSAAPATPPGFGLRSLTKRHFRTANLPQAPGQTAPLPFARRWRLLYNQEIDVAVIRTSSDDQQYSLNLRDELLYVLSGSGLLRCPLGDLAFEAGDYVLVPKGMIYRLLFHASADASTPASMDTPGGNPTQSEAVHILSLAFQQGVGIPNRFRTCSGQLRMDAPYCHRDFRTPQFRGPLEENIRKVWVRSASSAEAFLSEHSPLDVLGWDGGVYPWAFPILNFQPRVSSYHLPPTWHGTFAGPGFVVCSFVPRPLDFGKDALPCPYAHTSVDMDEVLFYAGGKFSSRRGVHLGSLTLHPAPVAHGPHPGRYEQSLGATHTNELAVMLDCTSALFVSDEAAAIEDTAYEQSF